MNARVGLLVALALGGAAAAEMGDGPATPWRSGAPQDVAELEAARSEAATCQTLTLAGALVDDPGAEWVQIHDVAITPQVLRDGDVPSYAFAGRDEGGYDQRVSFADVERFVVKAKTDTTITLALTIWPDIPPGELLAKQPTWAQLREGFRREVLLEMPIETREGRALEFAGGGPALAIEKLPVDATGDFYGGSPRVVNPRKFWWAVPSVTKDKDFPYRVMPKT